MDIEKVYKANKQLKKEDVRLLAEFLTEQPHLPKFNGKKNTTQLIDNKDKAEIFIDRISTYIFSSQL